MAVLFVCGVHCIVTVMQMKHILLAIFFKKIIARFGKRAIQVLKALTKCYILIAGYPLFTLLCFFLKKKNSNDIDHFPSNVWQF